MRKFIGLDTWKYGEKQVEERGTGKTFTLTQPHKLFSEDYYTVRRAIAVENVGVGTIPEPDFNVYEFSYMVSGCCLCINIIDETTAMKLIQENLREFLHGTAHQKIVDFLEKTLEEKDGK